MLRTTSIFVPGQRQGLLQVTGIPLFDVLAPFQAGLSKDAKVFASNTCLPTVTRICVCACVACKIGRAHV